MAYVKTIHAVDLFCGAGGTSTGLYRAADKLGMKVKLLAINHWSVAIATHSKNHQYAQHICETLDSVDPRKVVPRRKLDLLVASPECTHHSIARGGKPMNDQSRASAWHVLRWAEAIRIENIVVENVKEFMSWGPLGTNGLPLKRRKGELFDSFIGSLRALGYNVEHNILNAADYGDPTTRRRLFIIARLGRKKVSWPIATHSKDGGKGTRRWKPAESIIDWGLPSESISGRKRPLAPNTLRRIAAGLAKFGGEPFFAMMYGSNKVRSIKRPAPTVTAGGHHIGLCESFVMSAGGPERKPRKVSDPLYTVLCKDSLALVAPFIVPQFSSGSPQSVRKPLGVVTTTSRGMGLCTPFLLQQQSGGQPRSTGHPVPTIATKGAISLVEPYLVAHNGERKGQKPRVHSIKKPMPTVTPRGFELVEPHLVCVNHGNDKKSGKPGGRTRSLKDPMPTLTAINGWGLLEPYIIEYYGNGGARSVKEPLPTQTTKEKFALIQAQIKKQDIQYVLDIRFRMLQPHELAAAMSFSKNYKFQGTKSEITRQVGNAVPIKMSKAICLAVFRRIK